MHLSAATPAPAEPSALPAATYPACPVTWSPAHRVGFRFACSYLLLYLFPSPLNFLPGVGALVGLHARAWEALVQAVARHVLGFTSPLGTLSMGSGDSLFSYVRHLTVLGLALLATAAWSLLGTRQRAYPRTAALLRVYVRYALASAMLTYGLIKVFALQFPQPDVTRLYTRYGDSSPMGLLWTFMGASVAYQVFCGAVELAAGLLLLFRRTTLLGALLSAMAMANVVALNFFYDVPVKLYSTHLLLIAGFLLLPDLRRLADVLVLHRAVAAPPALRAPFSDRRLEYGRHALKALFVCTLLGVMTWSNVERSEERAAAPELAPLQGVWEVESFEPRTASVGPETRWHELAVGRGRAVVRSGDGSLLRYGARADPAQRLLVLTSGMAPAQPALAYSQPDAEHLLLESPELRVRLKRGGADFLLTSRGFRWVNEVPFNR
jgi:hypothetical protein